MPDIVECLSSASFPGDPIFFSWDGERREVETILDRWRAPGRTGFRVLTNDGLALALIYSEGTKEWRIGPLILPSTLAGTRRLGEG
jgi:hypothetical protein